MLDENSFTSRSLKSVATAPLTAAVGYIAKRVLEVWGILDGMSDAIGRWLKVHVSADQLGWTIALVITLSLYAFVLWRIWQPRIRHRHHVLVEAKASTNASLNARAIRASDQPKPR